VLLLLWLLLLLLWLLLLLLLPEALTPTNVLLLLLSSRAGLRRCVLQTHARALQGSDAPRPLHPHPSRCAVQVRVCCL
jgi:hypothetical protein